MNSTIIKNSDVMTQSYAMVDGLVTIAEAIKIALENGVEILFVKKRNEHDEYGMVSMSDIAKKVIAKDRSPERVNVYEIMTKPVVSVHGYMDIRYTARLFENFGISRAPVIEGAEILGVVSYNEIVLKRMLEK
ncbi:CBS domain-containing protein [Parashewanella spongiae]|uniref:CBS domain-containing protein n=1 Tax=Parashewanella spongiae TaxID=342950 RepID=A0A3A6U0M0_9GAMM|nr:CBS domain-containing protein [Parashewanella spongiae]MCL1079943.1 CBS domain-containing protein [Parashewanella spongiae]RJY06192.1 CBS domain-containing protein [Parashewanella spongiae]